MQETSFHNIHEKQGIYKKQSNKNLTASKPTNKPNIALFATKASKEASNTNLINVKTSNKNLIGVGVANKPSNKNILAIKQSNKKLPSQVAGVNKTFCIYSQY